VSHTVSFSFSLFKTMYFSLKSTPIVGDMS